MENDHEVGDARFLISRCTLYESHRRRARIQALEDKGVTMSTEAIDALTSCLDDWTTETAEAGIFQAMLTERKIQKAVDSVLSRALEREEHGEHGEHEGGSRA